MSDVSCGFIRSAAPQVLRVEEVEVPPPGSSSRSNKNGRWRRATVVDDLLSGAAELPG